MIDITVKGGEFSIKLPEKTQVKSVKYEQGRLKIGLSKRQQLGNTRQEIEEEFEL